MTKSIEVVAFEEPGLPWQQDAASGDRFAALVERQSRFVFRVAYSVVRNVQDAEDVVQDTFLKLYRTSKWQGLHDERAFLARAAWRVAVDHRSRIVARVPHPEVPDAGENPERVAVLADWSAVVHRLINALPEELRQPLALSATDELSPEEIAAIMGIPNGTVRSRLSRARGILKQKLSQLGAGYE